MNAYSFNSTSKSKKIAKTMISIHFKVRNCQAVLPINVTEISSEDRTILSREFGKNPIFAYHQSIAYHFLVTVQRSSEFKPNMQRITHVWMSHKLQTKLLFLVYEYMSHAEYRQSPMHFVLQQTLCLCRID